MIEGLSPHRAFSWLHGHVGFAIGVLVFLASLAWLTAIRGQPDWIVVLYAAMFAALYRVTAKLGRFSARLRENLEFAVLGVGLAGLLLVLTGGRMAAVLPIYTTIIIFAIFALGLNLQFGYTGIINFGHVAFMAIGAYTTVILSIRWLEHSPALVQPAASLWVLGGTMLVAALILGVLFSVAAERLGAPRPGASQRLLHFGAAAAGAVVGAFLVRLAIPTPLTPMWAAALTIFAAAVIGMFVAALAGVILGMPTLRLRADYLAIVTIGAAEILRRFLRNEAWLTRGHFGFPQSPRPFQGVAGEWPWLQASAAMFGLRESVLLMFLLSLGVLLLVVAGFAILLRSPYGRVLRAIREDEEVPRAVGKNVFRFKLQVFAIGGAVAAIAGSLYAWDTRFISPAEFVPLITFWAWIIVVVGGVGNNKGTILGAIILWTFFFGTQFLNLDAGLGLTSAQGSALRIVLIGVLLIVLMLFKPEGLLGRREEMVLGR